SVALIPKAPLTPGAAYTVSLAGTVDLGEGPKPYARNWSFTTAPEHRPLVRRMTSTTMGGVMQQIGLEGSGFGQGLRVYIGGLPVGSLTLESAQSIAVTPPRGLAGTGPFDLLMVTPAGSEIVWRDLFGGRPVQLPAASSPMRSVPLRVHGADAGVAALQHVDGPLLLPEAALAALGALRAEVPEIERTYWTWAGRTGDYMAGRAVARVGDTAFLLGLPVQRWDGLLYVDREFVSRLTGEPLQVADGAIEMGMRDLGAHWARNQVVRLLRDGVVSGTGDGRYRPDESLTRAAFVKMLTQARGLKPLPGQTGNLADTAGHWVAAQGFIGAAVQAGIVVPAEYPGGKFGPDLDISREEMAVMVSRALGLEAAARARQVAVKDGVAAIGGKPFSDAATWTRPGHIAVAVEKGIITGYREADGRYTFRPYRQATRAEAAVMVVRTLSQ
ncbi:MAG TPA: S-layer homology domain-containing protein, partial [Symbiobacteriaceae bacterium]|nr:S-layer homology domain-containing protein [Symbiobacteriaceae bacterium]